MNVIVKNVKTLEKHTLAERSKGQFVAPYSWTLGGVCSNLEVVISIGFKMFDHQHGIACVCDGIFLRPIALAVDNLVENDLTVAKFLAWRVPLKLHAVPAYSDGGEILGSSLWNYRKCGSLTSEQLLKHISSKVKQKNNKNNK